MPRDDGACYVIPFESNNVMDALVHGAKVVRGLNATIHPQHDVLMLNKTDTGG
jgi:hypothetical protein